MIRRLSLTAALLGALALAGCSDRDGAAETAAPRAEAGELNLYTARHYDADLLLYDAFTRQTGIKVNRMESNADQIIERMRAEGSASPADVVLMADAGALWRAEQAGLLQPARSEVLDSRIPANLRDPEGEWFGFSRRARVVAYDKARVRPEELATYEAIASPRFRGKLCVRSSDNVYNLSLMGALIEQWGAEKAGQWARGVVANMARQPQGGDTDQIRAVGAGACEIALTNSYYFLRLPNSDDAADKALADRLGLAFPSLEGQGSHVNISGGGVARHAPNRANAVRFLEFLASDEAQQIVAGANNEFPAVPGVTPPASVAAYADFTAHPMPVSAYGPRQAEAQRIFDQAGWR